MDIEAGKLESDWAAFRMHEKAHKQAKKESFEYDVLPKIKDCKGVSFVTDKSHFYKIGFKDGNIFDYYPGKNRLFQTKPSMWFYDGKNILLDLIRKCNEVPVTIHDPELPGVVIVDKVNP